MKLIKPYPDFYHVIICCITKICTSDLVIICIKFIVQNTWENNKIPKQFARLAWIDYIKYMLIIACIFLNDYLKSMHFLK